MNALTNSDISTKIRSLREIKDPCDRAVALAQFEPEYKQSKFYKLTKRPLQQLYYEITITDLLSLESLLQNFNNFITQLDSEKLVALFDEVNTQTLDTMRESMSTLETSGLMDILSHNHKS